MKRRIISNTQHASCYFRTSVNKPHRKALIQITERCNLHCAHCFVSAEEKGNSMSFNDIEDILIPRLVECRVISVSLTGGEPFIHERIMDIATLFRSKDIKITMCTNGTLITDEQMQIMSALGGISCNVSLDGFSSDSHGKFRGSRSSFEKTTSTIRKLAEHNLLKGLLVTPNNLAITDEYTDLCKFAADNEAEYILMNPLSSMGRGAKSVLKLATPDDVMRKIATLSSRFSDRIQVVNIRFPNDKKLPLSSCEAGNIIYVFTSGELTVCPYMVFSAKTLQSLHGPEEFIVGNIFQNEDIASKLDSYNLWNRYDIGGNPTCRSCSINSQCGKGCPAAVIALGKRIGEVDVNACPMVNIND